MKSQLKSEKPIIYSCSGCSSIAQLANQVAVDVDREELAEMSCIVGVGGNVKPLVKKAKSGRKIIVLDGCPLQCAKHCLSNHDIHPDVHYTLTDYDIKKVYHKDYLDSDYKKVKAMVKSDLEKLGLTKAI